MRVRRNVGLVLALSVVLACGGDASSVSVDRAQIQAPGRGGGPVPGRGLAVGRALTAMSRNLYLGADLDPVMSAGSQQAFLAATTAVWAMVNKNDFHVRAEAIADEIAARRPELVGLQEAYLWRLQSPGDAAIGGTTPATHVVYDYVQDILDALRARGLHYRAAATVELFDFEAPVLSGNTAAPFDDVRMADRGVILARVDVQTANAEGHVYGTLLPVKVLGQELAIKRGWVSVEARERGQTVRFVSTHLEAFHPGVRTAQAGELAAALAGESRPVVLVGDLNSEPGTEGEAVLAAAGFHDTWAALHPGAAGLTCCYLEDLTLPDTLETRIDYVLFRGPFAPLDMTIVGTAQQSGLWPSDHAGVVADLQLASRGAQAGGVPHPDLPLHPVAP